MGLSLFGFSSKSKICALGLVWTWGFFSCWFHQLDSRGFRFGLYYLHFEVCCNGSYHAVLVHLKSFNPVALVIKWCFADGWNHNVDIIFTAQTIFNSYSYVHFSEIPWVFLGFFVSAQRNRDQSTTSVFCAAPGPSRLFSPLALSDSSVVVSFGSKSVAQPLKTRRFGGVFMFACCSGSRNS